MLFGIVRSLFWVAKLIIYVCVVGKVVSLMLPFVEQKLVKSDVLVGPRVESKGKWAVVTGGTDGLGLEMSRQLAKRGLSILIIGRSAQRLEDAMKQVKETTKKDATVRTLCMDLSDPDFAKLEDACKTCHQDGGIALLVNNAGVSYVGAKRFDELSEVEIDTMISLNLRTVIRLTHTVFKLMTSVRKGTVLCIGSGSASLPSDPLYCVYTATKAGVAALCESLRVEAEGRGVDVQCHAPLLVPSKLSKCKEGLFSPSVKDYTEKAIQMLEGGISPMLKGHAIGITAVRSPVTIHYVLQSVAHLLPMRLWDFVRFTQTAGLRVKFIAKQAKGNKGGIETKENEEQKEVVAA